MTSTEKILIRKTYSQPIRNPMRHIEKLMASSSIPQMDGDGWAYTGGGSIIHKI